MTTNAILKGAFAAFIAGALAVSSPAFAKGGNGHGNSGGHGNPHAASSDQEEDEDGDSKGGHSKAKKITLREHDRIVIREYIGDHHRKWCPPGLAKKHNGCMPPGQLKYRVGGRLPTEVRYETLPRSILRSLTPLPPDEIYIRTGRDVYVMDKTTRIILDAVTLMNDLN
ncbi:MAG: hypothetical protein EPN97_01480 [Alphaproteobacteria bacterium]|nr:MAG: hypothetical protein EPN97_01480 [Alphaproteobacteria bacterium]